jgi:hypothetical protein
MVEMEEGRRGEMRRRGGRRGRVRGEGGRRTFK